MQFPPPGHIRTADDLRDRLRELGADFDIDERIEPAAFSAATRLYGHEMTNRFCTHPMEGWDGTADGGVI